MHPIFILGCPRSGTTLLGGLFVGSPWGDGVETHFITKHAAEGAVSDLTNRQAFEQLTRKIVAHRAIRQWAIDWNTDELFERCHPKTYPRLVDAICRTRSDQLGYQSWADKTPHYSFEVVSLRHWFPDAKFVIIHRDGRDVAHSLLNRNWGPNNIWACANYWRRCCQTLLDAQQSFPEDRIHSLRYEDLLMEPDSTLNCLSNFLGLEGDQRIQPKSPDHLRQDNFDKWRRNLSPRQICIFERTAGDVLNTLGYVTSHNQQPLSSVGRLAFQVDDRVRWAKFMFQQNVVDGIKIRFFGKQPFAE